jgi:glycosyltransferase involved in cell wall biosynthesis
MHIGYVCQFNPAPVADLLDPACREAARTAGGRRNAPVANLLQALLQRGHRITVFSAEPTTTAPRTFTGPGLTLIRLPQRPAPFVATLDQFRVERKALLRAIREARPDVVHAHWTQTGHALAALDSGMPCWVTVHDTALIYEWYNRGWNPIRLLASLQRLAMTARIARRARSLIAVSPDVAAHLRRVFRYRGDLHVIPNPLPISLYRSIRETRHKLYDPATPVFADVTGWGRIKNTTTLLRAFQTVKARIPHARLLLFGTGLARGGPGQAWAERRGLNLSGVEFRGPLEQETMLRTLADEVDFVVHLALMEANCMAMGEALSISLPVLAGDVGGNAWTIRPHTPRLIRNVRCPGEAAEAMLRLTREGPSHPDPAVWAAWEKRVDPASIARQLETLYTGGSPGPDQPREDTPCP